MPLQWELLRLRLVGELSHGLRSHNWRQAGLLPNRDLGSHDLSEQLSPTVLPCSTIHCRMGMSSVQRPCSCTRHVLYKAVPSLPHKHTLTHKIKLHLTIVDRTLCVLPMLPYKTIGYQVLVCSPYWDIRGSFLNNQEAHEQKTSVLNNILYSNHLRLSENLKCKHTHLTK